MAGKRITGGFASLAAARSSAGAAISLLSCRRDQWRIVRVQSSQRRASSRQRCVHGTVAFLAAPPPSRAARSPRPMPSTSGSRAGCASAARTSSARYGCDPRRLYEIWEGDALSRQPRARRSELFRERYPGLARPHRSRPAPAHFRGTTHPDQLTLFSTELPASFAPGDFPRNAMRTFFEHPLDRPP